jgi:hypothetical protein
MGVRMSKSIFPGLAALIVLIAVSVSTPAAAFRMGGGGFHGGGFGGGFHGGGFGGWRGGGFGGWRGGYGWGGRGWGYGGWGCCGWGYAGWSYPWWGWGYPYGYGDDYGSGWGPDYAGYGYPPPTVEAAPAGSIAKSGRSQADEAATSGGGLSTSANRSPERRTPLFCLFCGQVRLWTNARTDQFFAIGGRLPLPK